MSYKNWSYNADKKQYIATHKVAKRLPSGMYNLKIAGFGEPATTSLRLRDDKIKVFQNGPLPRVMREISKFWASGKHYEKLGVSHKRSILMHGPAGCGKSGIISSIIEQTIKDDGLVFQVNNLRDFQECFDGAMQVEDGRNVVVTIEDMEKLCPYNEENLLEILDGTSSIGNHILFVSTTNKLNKIPTRIRCRPSRVDTLIEIGFPDKEQRREYLEFILGKDKSDLSPAKLADATNKFSLAMLKELVVSIQVYGKSLKEAISLIRQMAKGSDTEEDEE